MREWGQYFWHSFYRKEVNYKLSSTCITTVMQVVGSIEKKNGFDPQLKKAISFHLRRIVVFYKKARGIGRGPLPFYSFDIISLAVQTDVSF